MVSVTQHHKNVRAMRCLISDRPGVTLHHVHGGSMKQFGQLRGTGLKVSDYLVLPIHADFHVGKYGCDSGMGILTWEMTFGSQFVMLQEVSQHLGYDVFELAGLEIGES